MGIGDRLKQIRLARGFSMDDLVVEIGGIVTKQALSKYENNKAQPTLRVLNALSKTLVVKTAYFFETPPFSVNFIGFRKKSGLRQREQEKVQNRIKQLMEDRIRLQRLARENVSANLPIHQFPIDNPMDIEKASSKIRDSWDLGLAPVSNVVEMLEEKQVHVLELEEDDNFDGQSATVQDEHGKTIAVAVVTRRLDSGERQRFNLLHELGHLVLKTSGVEKEDEKAAHRFASSFLAPEKTVRQLVGSKRRLINERELFLLKRYLGMSAQAILYRLKDLEIITESHHREWCIIINRKGWKKEEPEKIPREEPQWLRRTIFQGLAEKWLTTQEAEIMLEEPIKGDEISSLRERRAFMRLPVEQRRKKMEKQARELAKHYTQNEDWKDIEGDDIVEY